jgi:hypothetical protein
VESAPDPAAAEATETGIDVVPVPEPLEVPSTAPPLLVGPALVAPSSRSPVPPRAPAAEPAPAPAEPKSGDALQAVVDETVGVVSVVVQPAAAATVASTFGFPLGLMLAVVLFLAIQTRLDRRDARLRAALDARRDQLVPFEEEEQL